MEPAARAALHRAIAARVAEAHRSLGDTTLFSFVSGSTVENLVDERSDIDMSVVLQALPDASRLQACCHAAGGSTWNWTVGDPAQGSWVVSFRTDGVETQIGYATHAALAEQMDELLVHHNPDTPLHKLAEGILKAEPLVDAERLRALQQRLAQFPDALRLAMVAQALKTPTPWRAIAQIIHRDADLWCREIQVEACYRLLLALCGLNRRFFTRFQVKRMHKLAASLALAPAQLADRIEALLRAAPATAFEQLHALETDLLALIEAELPAVDTAPARQRLAAFVPG